MFCRRADARLLGDGGARLVARASGHLDRDQGAPDETVRLLTQRRWRGVAPLPAHHFTVVCADLRGHEALGFAHHQSFDRVRLHDRLEAVHDAAGEMAVQPLRERLVERTRKLKIVALGVGRIPRVDTEHEDGT